MTAIGKRLIVQRRGRGSPTFTCPSWRRVGPVRYPPPISWTLSGKVVELTHDPGRGCPVARVGAEDGTEFLMIAPEGMYVGQEVRVGPEATITAGNILPLAKIPEGTQVCNVELKLGDGGKIARTSGAYATVLAHTGERTLIQLPSGKTKAVGSDARATIGIVAGGGRVEKPFLKAGKICHLARAKAWKYPVVRGKAMVAASHPHGGGSHPTGGRPASRTAPPGAKVGHIASRRTGRRR